MFDSIGRHIDTLRVSLTDRCNLNCWYCKGQKTPCTPDSAILPINEIRKLIGCFISAGIKKIKLTGGEPLLRNELVDLVADLSCLPLSDMLVTTNGTVLSTHARDLYAAGLKRINISIDTLNAAKYHFITGADLFRDVWKGIESALESGLSVKINTVVIRGFNDGEVADFVKLARDFPGLIVRFIELMPTRGIDNWQNYFTPREEMLRRIEDANGPISSAGGVYGSGPAEYFKICRTGAVFGIISPVSKPFCRWCNRIRIDARGRLILCLHHDLSFDLAKYLKADEKELSVLLENIVLHKPRGHKLGTVTTSDVVMSAMGG
jgi:cyclic pyranopterin phosphate synthase